MESRLEYPGKSERQEAELIVNSYHMSSCRGQITRSESAQGGTVTPCLWPVTQQNPMSSYLCKTRRQPIEFEDTRCGLVRLHSTKLELLLYKLDDSALDAVRHSFIRASPLLPCIEYGFLSRANSHAGRHRLSLVERSLARPTYTPSLETSHNTGKSYL